jgi:hypothetical protein
MQEHSIRKNARKGPLRSLLGLRRSPVLLTIMLALLRRLFQFFLVISQQSMNLPMSLVTDSVDLRSKILAQSCRIFIEQSLDLIVVLLKQRPDLLLLNGS